MVVARVTELLRLHISNIAPRGLCRGHHCSRRPEERHLFLLVNANKVLLPNVGLCEHCACNTGTGAECGARSFYHHQRVIPSSVAQACHAAWSLLTVNLHV